MTAPPPVSRARSVASLLRWAFESFGPIIAFLGVEHAFGLVPAIVAGVVVSIAIVAFQWVREKTPSKLTVITAASVVVFGLLGLVFRSVFFLKFEPVVENLIWAGVFFASAATGAGLIVEMVERKSGVLPEARRRYLHRLTIAWGVFMLARAAAYAWMAFHLTLDQAIATRAVVGPVSLGGMFALEMGYRYLRYGKKGFKTPAAPAVASTAKPAA
jgi:intracellular septation protein A